MLNDSNNTLFYSFHAIKTNEKNVSLLDYLTYQKKPHVNHEVLIALNDELRL